MRTRVVSVLEQCARHFVRRQHEVHETGSDHIRRHARLRSRVRRLGHTRPSSAFIARAQHALGPHAGQHDADGIGALVGRQRPEEVVDRPSQPAPIRHLIPEKALVDGERSVGRMM